jgi:hypothetical protein
MGWLRKGGELEEREIHALANICELNMPDEAEKFAWFAFAKGLSRVSGLRGLAKVARWDDRSKVSLRVSLLPYLTALIEDEKISPETALGLFRLSGPVELYELRCRRRSEDLIPTGISGPGMPPICLINTFL